jgi:nucleotide-binding universal stress UspA family protein
VVHVVEPVNDYYIGSLYGVASIQTELIFELERDRRASAEVALNDLVSSFGSKTVRQAKVLVGSPDVAVLDFVKHEKADGLIIGASSGNYGFVPARFSNALAMVREAFCPVIVLPPKVLVDSSHGRLSFLLADDLTEGSKPAVVFAHRLQRSYPESMVWHAHVVRDDFNLDSEGFLKALGKRPQQEVILKRIKNQLALRFGFMDEISKGDGQYEGCVSFGQVGANLLSLAQQKKPDFIIFGPHHAFRVNPFGFGAMSWTEIMHSSKPVILVPT